jgi:ABC-type multidrug transport system permease subunit
MIDNRENYENKDTKSNDKNSKNNDKYDNKSKSTENIDKTNISEGSTEVSIRLPSDTYDEYGFRIYPTVLDNDENKKKHKDKYKENLKTNVFWSFAISSIIIYIILMILAAYIAWNCYSGSLRNIRILKTLLACIFNIPYLCYFFFMRIILKVPCF